MDVTRRWGVIAAMAFSLALLRAAAAHAAIAVDSVSSSSGQIVNSLTWAHTVGTGADRVLVVGVTIRDGNVSVSAITYGGTALTRLGFQNGAGNANRAEIWSLKAPASGTANVVVSISGARDLVGGSISFTGVDQTTPFGTFVGAQGTSATPSVTASSATAEIVVDTLATDGDAVSATVGAGQTQRWNIRTGPAGGNAIGAGSTKPGATSVSMKWTLGASKQWGMGAVPLKPASCASQPDGTPCNDGDACTQTDTCQSGICVGSNPVTCTALDQCHVAGTCDPTTGICSNPTATDGTACNDGNACTQTDTCQSGTCVGSNPVTCTALDQCHVAGTCNPATGICSNPTVTDGTAC